MRSSIFSFRFSFWTAALGNFFEHYDGALYSFLCSYLAFVICPGQDPALALIKAYAIIPLGMLARPLGALVFGAIGDRLGRSNALCITLIGMGCVSLCFAMTPFFSFFSSAAFLLFAIGRLLQNFFSAGETVGGAIYLLENEKTKKEDILSGLYGASSIGGILLASSLAALFAYFNLLKDHWHYLYLVGCITAIFGFILRKSSVIENKRERPFSLKEYAKVFWVYRKPLSIIALVSGFSYANYSIAMILSSGFIPMVADVSIDQMMQLNTMLLVLDLLLLPFFGWLASKVSREKVMFYSALAASLLAIPLFLALPGASLYLVMLVRAVFVLIGTAFAAPFHSFIQQLLPEQHRYSILSFGYALGCQVLGAPTSSFSLWLYHKYELPACAGLYWMLLSLAAVIVMARMIFKPSSLSSALRSGGKL